MSKRQCGNIFLSGGLSSGDNRWFDKSIQIICTENGKAGLVGGEFVKDVHGSRNFRSIITSVDASCTVMLFLTSETVYPLNQNTR